MSERYGSSILGGIPLSLASAKGFIRVAATLQVEDSSMPNIFAIGDIADTGAPKMGRAAALQGMVAAKNVMRLIQRKPLEWYIPGIIDQSIDLTLDLVSKTASMKAMTELLTTM